MTEPALSNPLVVVLTLTHHDAPAGRALWIWCPGCEQAHAPQVAGVNGDRPAREVTWDWNGATDETFTINPSLLCHGSVHLCDPKEHVAVCETPDVCDHGGHLILNAERGSRQVPPEGERILGYSLPHTADPAFGDCHSFIRNGHWEFLLDSAHHLAGQTVPMVPVPDWLVR